MSEMPTEELIRLLNTLLEAERAGARHWPLFWMNTRPSPRRGNNCARSSTTKPAIASC